MTRLVDEDMMKFSTIGWIAGVALVGAGFAIEIYPYLTNAEGVEKATSRAAAIAPLPDSDWAISETDDPMTDLHTVSASRVFQGERLLIDAAIKCTGGSDLTYEFGTFDTEKKGVQMATQADAYSLKLMEEGLLPAGPVIRFQVRLDDRPAEQGHIVNPRYANVLSIGGKTHGLNSADLASADRLRIRLPTRGGDETIEIDQTNSDILNVLRACNGGRESPGTEEFNGSSDY